MNGQFLSSRAARPAGRGSRSLRAAGTLALAMLLVLLGTTAAQAQGTGAEAGFNYVRLTFWVFAISALIGGGLTILMRNPVVSALCLVGTLFCTGGIYLTLHCTFLAAIQVLVYAGAIMVLFIFVVMSVGQVDHEETFSRNSLVSKGVGVIAVGVLLFAILIPLLKLKTVGVPMMTAISEGSDFGKVEYVGRLLFGNYLFPFEALSVLLLVAIVGAVLISRRATATREED